MGAVQEVKQRADIVDVISQYTKLTKAGRTFRGLCPFHTEKTPSFFVYPEQQNWHCFGACGTGGDVFSFLMKKENLSFGEALGFLAQRVGITLPEKFPTERREEKEVLYQINEAAAHYFHHSLVDTKAGENTRQYVTRRGFSEETINNFQLGFSLDNWEALKTYLQEKGFTEERMLALGLIIASEDGRTHDRFRNRLMFPIYDAGGHVVGFGARALDDAMPKYLNSPQSELFDKSATLYGLNFAARAIRQQDLAVIVEGYVDVITAHQHGFTNVVASMGTSITETQVHALKKLSRNLILALDADSAGQEAMLRGIQYENILDAEIRVLVMPEGQDPDDVIKEDPSAWQKLLEKALPIVDFTFNAVSAGVDLNTARGQSQATEELLPVIAGIRNPVRQAHYQQKLVRLVKAPEHSVELALRRIKSGTTARRKHVEEPAARPRQTVADAPLEEHCLALLLQHPELRHASPEIAADYFLNSENREVFAAWQLTEEPAALKEKLDPALHEYVDFLMGKQFPPGSVEQRYTDYARRLRLGFHRNLEARQSEILAMEAAQGGAGADLTKLEEMGTDAVDQIREYFRQKLGQGKRRS